MVEGLEGLLRWVNGDALSAAEVRESIWLFLAPNSGVQQDLVVRGQTYVSPHLNYEIFRRPGRVSARGLDRIRRKVHRMLAMTAPLAGEEEAHFDNLISFSSLRFHFVRLDRGDKLDPKVSALSPRERRKYFATSS